MVFKRSIGWSSIFAELAAFVINLARYVSCQKRLQCEATGHGQTRVARPSVSLSRSLDPATLREEAAALLTVQDAARYTVTVLTDRVKSLFPKKASFQSWVKCLHCTNCKWEIMSHSRRLCVEKLGEHVSRPRRPSMERLGKHVPHSRKAWLIQDVPVWEG